MTYAPYIPPELQNLIDESCAIKWLIYINGGNATKSSVEDVLILRNPNTDRVVAHDVQNLIEYHCLLQSSFINRRWLADGNEPQLQDYPEINQLARYPVRWYRGNPFEATND